MGGGTNLISRVITLLYSNVQFFSKKITKLGGKKTPENYAPFKEKDQSTETDSEKDLKAGVLDKGFKTSILKMLNELRKMYSERVDNSSKTGFLECWLIPDKGTQTEGFLQETCTRQNIDTKISDLYEQTLNSEKGSLQLRNRLQQKNVRNSSRFLVSVPKSLIVNLKLLSSWFWEGNLTCKLGEQDSNPGKK